MENSKTISRVLYDKFVDFLEENKLATIALAFSRISLAAFFSVSLSNTRLILGTLQKTWFFYDSVIPKFIFCLLVVWNYRYIFKCFRSVFSSLSEYIPRKEIEVETFMGMEVQELVDYILQKKTIRREEFSKRFSIGRDTAGRLIQKLDEIGLFMRGDNNARILNAEFSPEDIYNIFSGREIIDDLKMVYRQVGDGRFEAVTSLAQFQKKKIIQTI